MKLNLDEIEKALGEFSEGEDLSHFFAHAPEWLRLLVERVKELESALSFYAEDDRQSVELEILESVNLRPATSALKGSI